MSCRRNLADSMARTPQWVVGMMSGTSLDGVDVALIRTDGETISDLGPWTTIPYEPDVAKVIEQATRDAVIWNFERPEPHSFDQAGKAVTMAHIRACKALLARADTPAPVLAGFHGQTVLHRAPSGSVPGATRQLGDGALLADALSCPVVYDFRAHDMVSGGHGAPLAPVYHVAFLRELFPKEAAVALNIGGVANITFVSPGFEVTAFDAGPGNGPIDSWMQAHGAGRFDEDGRAASAGKVDQKRVNAVLRDPYFAAAPPKSLDKSRFPASIADGLSLEDGAATLTALSARAILTGFDRLSVRPDKVIVTGGGVHNPTLMRVLRSELGAALVETPRGVRPDAVEAEAFAYLAARSVRGLPLSFPGTTGVPRPMTGGVLVCR